MWLTWRDGGPAGPGQPLPDESRTLAASTDLGRPGS
jgi:hypothetical protein